MSFLFTFHTMCLCNGIIAKFLNESFFEYWQSHKILVINGYWFMAVFLLRSCAKQGKVVRKNCQRKSRKQTKSKWIRKRRTTRMQKRRRTRKRIAINRSEMMMFYRIAHSCDNDALKSFKFNNWRTYLVSFLEPREFMWK